MKKKTIKLIDFLDHCPEIVETLAACTSYGLKNYYLAGGAITQLVWNNLLGHSALNKIKDFDIIYFNKDEDNKADINHQRNINQLISHNIPIDLVNQAYVHEWYSKKYGNQVKPFQNTEDGIKTWLPAFAIGVRKVNAYEIFAPYGLEDTFQMTVRPNKRAMSKDNYLSMTENFKRRWEHIKVLDWD